MDRGGTSKADRPDRRPEADVEIADEFSVASQESKIGNDENILDLKVMNADFYLDAFNQIPNLNLSKDELSKQLITVCTVDFYNHGTETT